MELNSSDESMKQNGSRDGSGVSQATEGVNSSRPIKRIRLDDSSHREVDPVKKTAVRRSKRPYSPAIQFVQVSDAPRSVQLFKLNPPPPVASRSCTTISEGNRTPASGPPSGRSGGDHRTVQRLHADSRFPRSSARHAFGVHRGPRGSARSVSASARTPFHPSPQRLRYNHHFPVITQPPRRLADHVRRLPAIPPYRSNRVVVRQPTSTTMLHREQVQPNAHLIAAVDEYFSRAGHDLWHVPPPFQLTRDHASPVDRSWQRQ